MNKYQKAYLEIKKVTDLYRGYVEVGEHLKVIEELVDKETEELQRLEFLGCPKKKGEI